MTLPSFIVIGAPRCGTTSLHYALARHPGVFLPACKEVDFFLRDEAGRLPAWAQRRNDEIPWSLAEYASLFDGARRGAVVGDVSPGYLWQPVAGRIRAALPMVRLVCILRHPVDHARSVLATWSGGRQPTEYELARRLDSGEPGPRGEWPLAEHGQFGGLLAPYFDEFSRGQVLVVAFEELTRFPDDVLHRIQQHVRVEPRRLRLPHYNASAMQPRPSRAKTWLKRNLPDGAVRALARIMHEVRGSPLYPATLSTDFRAEMMARHYAGTCRHLRTLGVDVDRWWGMEDEATPVAARA